MNKKYKFLVYSKEDLDNFKEINLVDCFLPITPNAKSIIINRKLKTNFKHLQFTYKSKLKINEEIRKHLNLFNFELEKKKYNRYDITSSLNIFYILISSYFSLKSMIEVDGPWIVYDGKKFIKSKDYDKVISIIFIRMFSNSYNFFNLKSIGNYKIKIVNFYNNLAIYFSKKNKILLSTKFYGYKTINSLTNKKNVSLVFFERIENNILLKSLSNIIKLFFDRRNIYLFSYYTKENSNENKTSKKNFYNIDHFSYSFINNLIIKNLNFSKNFEINISELLNNSVKLFISHELCWLENLFIAKICNYKQIDVHLISHGSHAITTKKEDNFTVNLRANGMLYSEFADLNIVQSIQAYNYMKKRKPNHNIISNKPIMWGVSNYILNKDNFNNSKEFTILHASTFKIFGARHWIYENSFEYIDNINFLIKKISQIPNIKLIIRYRENIDNYYNTTKNLILNSPNVEIKLGGSNLYQDIMKSDLVISYSSTVIEESLYLKKPVALFGNDHYRHIPYSNEVPKNNKMKPVYSLNRDNFDKMIKGIISAHKDFTNELNFEKYCFQDQELYSYETHLKEYLDN